MVNIGSFLKTVVIGALGLWFANLSLAVASERPSSQGKSGSIAGAKPNIIFILTDDQGYGDLGRNGNPVIQTPNIDKLYDEAVRFEDFHVSPSCSPTRAAILSGKHNFKSGVTSVNSEQCRMSLKTTTLPQILKSAGYQTGIFGKWHLGDTAEYQPGSRGFDEVLILGAGGFKSAKQYYDPSLTHNGKKVKTTGYCTDVFFEHAIKWIGEQKGKAPFFAYIPTNAPHDPLTVPEKYEKMYEGKVDAETATYFGMLTNIDENVGKLIAKLKEMGIDNNTLIVVMNDNGGWYGVKLFNAGMKGGKLSSSNGGTRAMSLWRWPGRLKPAACDKLTAHLDLLPTFADLAGATVPENVAKDLDGVRLVPLLENLAAKWNEDRILITHAGRWGPGKEPVKHGWCNVRWKQYLQVRDKKNKWTLFDLKADPGEKNDIAGQHKDVIEKLDKAYDAWWSDIRPRLENDKPEN